MRNLICWIKGHKRGKTKCKRQNLYYVDRVRWYIECSRCGYKFDYFSPRSRLISTELDNGFDGE